MVRVTGAVQRGWAGDRSTARQELEAMWAEVEQGRGDDFHRCVIAHFLADLEDDARDELRWDERALAAVDAYGQLVSGALDKISRALAEGSTEPLPAD